MQVQVDKEKQV
jgi:hypothetical protein